MPTESVTLEQLGWNAEWDAVFGPFRQEGFSPGRIAIEDKHSYYVLSTLGPVSGVVAGRLLNEAKTPADLPKVGDWVAMTFQANECKAVIRHVLPRRTKFSRKVPGRDTEEQVLVANVDVVFLVQALDRTFNPRLIERQLVMIHESGARPVVVLNKSDLCGDVPRMVSETASAASGAPIVTVSAKTGEHLEALRQLIRPGETVVFVGPSGVGKSSLINGVIGEEVQATIEVREADSKGRHTTSWRELILLPNGGIVIDTPGMREFQLWIADLGVQGAFSDIDAFAVDCHFRDCTHTHEAKCAVKKAQADGLISGERYGNYLKMRRELAQLDEAQAERAWQDRKRQSKIAQRAFNKIKRQHD